MRIALTCLVPAALMAGCSAPAPRHDAEPAAVTVVTEQVRHTALPSSFEAGGVVRARVMAVVASRLMASVVDVRVRPGDRVRHGDVLIRLDAREVEGHAAGAGALLVSADESERAAAAERTSAESALDLAQATSGRITRLFDQRSATPQERDQATAAVKAAEAQLALSRAHVAAAQASRDAARAALDTVRVSASYATLTAPFDGVVTQRLVDPGAMAVPGVPLLTIEDPSSSQLEAPVDDTRAMYIHVGQAVEVRLDAPEAVQPWTAARVVEIARLDPASHSFSVKVGLPAGTPARSGSFGRVRVSAGTRNVLTVSDTALVRRGQLLFVFVVDAGGRARLQPVSIGGSDGGRTEVLAGLHDGDRVVMSPASTLSDGVRTAEARR